MFNADVQHMVFKYINKKIIEWAIKLISWSQFSTFLINRIILGFWFCLFLSCVGLSVCFRPALLQLPHAYKSPGVLLACRLCSRCARRLHVCISNKLLLMLMLLVQGADLHSKVIRTAGPRGQRFHWCVSGWSPKNQVEPYWRWQLDDKKHASYPSFPSRGALVSSGIPLLQWWAELFWSSYFSFSPTGIQPPSPALLPAYLWHAGSC